MRCQVAVMGQRICRDCGTSFDAPNACNAVGEPYIRGLFCPKCGAVRANEILKDIERREANVRRNLWLAYRGWWKHYTPPLRWSKLLRAERDTCPYCGACLPNDKTSSGNLNAVLDHMDSISLGGEDSLRNVIYCCSLCNSRKKNKRFVDWLAELEEPFCSHSRLLYELKHQHVPELFESEGWSMRTEGTPLFLELDEAEFRKEFKGMLPLRAEPPALYLMDFSQPDPGPVDIESMIFSDESIKNIITI